MAGGVERLGKVSTPTSLLLFFERTFKVGQLDMGAVIEEDLE